LYRVLVRVACWFWNCFVGSSFGLGMSDFVHESKSVSVSQLIV
jgi:hypothetical protein